MTINFPFISTSNTSYVTRLNNVHVQRKSFIKEAGIQEWLLGNIIYYGNINNITNREFVHPYFPARYQLG